MIKKTHYQGSYPKTTKVSDISSKTGSVPGPAVIPNPLQVEVQGPSRDDFEKAHKLFRSIVQREKVISKYKECQYYEKPSAKKRRKRREAHEKRLAMASKMRLIKSGEWEKRLQKRAQKKDNPTNQ